MGVQVREMTELDLEAVYSINRRSFASDAWSRDAIEREFRLPYSKRFVLEIDGEVVGYTFVWLIRGEAFIMTFAVDPDHRGRGLGKMFLKKVIDSLSPQVESFTLDVRKSNLPAIRLYRSVGFSVVRERPRFYSDGENALVMELRVGKIECDEGDKREKAHTSDRGR